MKGVAGIKSYLHRRGYGLLILATGFTRAAPAAGLKEVFGKYQYLK